MKNKFIYKLFIIVLLVTSSPVSVFAGGGWDLPEPAPYLTNGIKLVNLDNSGNKKNFESEYNPPSISADGRYVSFYSESTDLVTNDTNEADDVFVRDTVSNTTTRISVSSSGEEGNGDSTYSSISADGRYIVFSSRASNLVDGDTNGQSDVFLRDTQENTTTRVSVSSSGEEGNSYIWGDNTPSISADGRYIAFESYASNLVDGDTNEAGDVFVRDTVSNTTIRVSVNSSGEEGNQSSRSHAISADGRYVVFSSYASNLVDGDTNEADDVFVRDTVSNTTTRISVSSSGEEGNGDSTYSSISADGRYIVFSSRASNLVDGDTNGQSDVFLRDTQENTTTRVSVSSSGEEGNSDMPGDNTPSISADGRYVVFPSNSSNLVENDTNGFNDIFLRDTQANITKRLTSDSLGRQGNSESFNSTISSDGNFIAFESVASNLVDGDTNDAISDMFIVSRQEVIPTPTPTPTRKISSGGIYYGCKDPNASNYEFFSASKPELCKYETSTLTTPTTSTPKNETGTCSLVQLLTQNLRAPSRNGIYNNYTKGIVKEAHILQAHLNRLGFNSGKEDGILGPVSTGAIKRMQTFLKTTPDGYVGPITRGLLNNSCGVNGLQN